MNLWNFSIANHVYTQDVGISSAVVPSLPELSSVELPRLSPSPSEPNSISPLTLW